MGGTEESSDGTARGLELPKGGDWHAACFYSAIMELENALNAELGRLVAVADAAAREIAAMRPWWVAAVAFLRKVAL